MTDAETITTLLAAAGLVGAGMAAGGIAVRKALIHGVYSGYSLTWTLSVKPPPKPKEPAPLPPEAAALPAAANGHAALTSLIREVA